MHSVVVAAISDIDIDDKLAEQNEEYDAFRTKLDTLGASNPDELQRIMGLSIKDLLRDPILSVLVSTLKDSTAFTATSRIYEFLEQYKESLQTLDIQLIKILDMNF